MWFCKAQHVLFSLLLYWPFPRDICFHFFYIGLMCLCSSGLNTKCTHVLILSVENTKMSFKHNKTKSQGSFDRANEPGVLSCVLGFHKRWMLLFLIGIDWEVALFRLIRSPERISAGVMCTTLIGLPTFSKSKFLLSLSLSQVSGMDVIAVLELKCRFATALHDCWNSRGMVGCIISGACGRYGMDK